MREPDPKKLLEMWCRERGLAIPAFVKTVDPDGGVGVLGSITFHDGRYLRAYHRAMYPEDAQLEVARDLVVQLQEVVGPLVVSGRVPTRQKTRQERASLRSALAQDREALRDHAQRRGAFLHVDVHYVKAKNAWIASGLWQLGREQIVAGPIEAVSRDDGEAQVVGELLRAATGDSPAGSG